MDDTDTLLAKYQSCRDGQYGHRTDLLGTTTQPYNSTEFNGTCNMFLIGWYNFWAGLTSPSQYATKFSNDLEAHIAHRGAKKTGKEQQDRYCATDDTRGRYFATDDTRGRYCATRKLSERPSIATANSIPEDQAFSTTKSKRNRTQITRPKIKGTTTTAELSDHPLACR